MKTQRVIQLLCWLIVLLSLFAAGTGLLWQPGGDHFDFTTLRGQAIQIQGAGLYRFDSVATASQSVAQDVVTLCIGIPLLIISILLYSKGSLRGKILLAGTLSYFLYTYGSMSMLSAYNELFLAYVALFSLSLFTFITTLTSIDTSTLPTHFTASFPRRTIAGFNLFVGLMLTVMWLGRIVPSLLDGTPPIGLGNSTTLVIQVMDLGLIVPAAILSAVLLLRRMALGYLLSSVVLAMGVTMGLATSAMVIGQLLASVEISPVEVIIFPTFAIVNITLAALLIRSISETPGDAQQISGQDGTRQVTARTQGEYLASPHKG